MARHANTGRGLARARKRRTEGGLFHKVGSALSKGLGRVAQAMSIAEDLDALDLLKAQHRAIDRLFREVQSASGTSKANCRILALRAFARRIRVVATNMTAKLLDAAMIC